MSEDHVERDHHEGCAACRLAEMTGRPHEDFESDADIPDFKEQDPYIADGGEELDSGDHRSGNGAALVRTVGGTWSVKPGLSRHRAAVERIWSNQFDDPTIDSHQDQLDAAFDPDHNLHPYTQVFVAEDSRDRVVGFGIASLRNEVGMSDHTTLDQSEFSGRDGYMFLGCVADGWKGRGIGTQLFSRRLRWCVNEEANAIYGVAWQNPDGPTSDPLFEKFGFEAVKELPNYYAGRDCAVCGPDCDCGGVVYRRNIDV